MWTPAVLLCWLDGCLAVKQQADELLGEHVRDWFAADEDSVEDGAGVNVEEKLGVDVWG